MCGLVQAPTINGGLSAMSAFVTSARQIVERVEALGEPAVNLLAERGT
jgi:hypothetical protein